MATEHDSGFHEERLQHHLQVQANQIQKVLAEHKATTTITGGFANRHAFQFNLSSPLSAGLDRLAKLKADFKKALGIEGIRFNQQDGQLHLEVLRPFDPAVPLLELMSGITNLAAHTAILGYAEDGTIVHHDFSQSTAPNILISGNKDAGKTILLRSMAASLALANKQADIQLIIIDPISADSQRRVVHAGCWGPLNYIPHMLTDVVNRQSEITEILLFLAREMNYRSEHLFNTPRIIIFIDQAATVLERGGRTVQEAIMRIAERGAEAGIHLVLGTQRPQSTHFTPHLLTNLQARFIGLGSPDPINTYNEEIVLDSSSLLGQGDFIACGLARQIRFQAAYIDDYDLHMGLSKLHAKRQILLAQPLSMRTQLSPSSAIEEVQQRQFTFADGLVAVS
jgi:DNA segregation ATPase FtsK/SpoIIIE, S-DNA-T family